MGVIYEENDKKLNEKLNDLLKPTKINDPNCDKITIYVKGSLGMKMDRVINNLEEWHENVSNSSK